MSVNFRSTNTKNVGEKSQIVVKPISRCVRTACSQCCNKSGKSCYHLVYKVDDGNRLATSCSNKTNTRLFVTSCYASLLSSTC